MKLKYLSLDLGAPLHDSSRYGGYPIKQMFQTYEFWNKCIELPPNDLEHCTVKCIPPSLT